MKLHNCKIEELVENIPLLQLNGSDSVDVALRMMDKHNRHAVGVEIWGKLAGVFSYSDFIKRVAAEGKCSESTCVVEVMTLDPCSITPDRDCYEAFRIMCQNGFDHLPVIDKNGRILCILSEEDLRTTAVEDLHKLEDERDMLKAYIGGEGCMRCPGC